MKTPIVIYIIMLVYFIAIKAISIDIGVIGLGLSLIASVIENKQT